MTVGRMVRYGKVRMHFFLKSKMEKSKSKNGKYKIQNGKQFAKVGKKLEFCWRTSFLSLFQQQFEMTSTQLPTTILSNIWEDSIKMEADAIIRKLNKKKYDDVLRQLNLILPLEEDNFNWYYDPESQNTDSDLSYVVPMIMDHQDRLLDFDNDYFYFRDIFEEIEESEPTTSWRPIGRFESFVKVYDKYDYDTDNIKNDEDLEAIKVRIANALQKSIDLLENNIESYETDSDSDYEDDFFDE